MRRYNHKNIATFPHDVIGYKKLDLCGEGHCDYLVTLLIPAGTPIYCRYFDNNDWGVFNDTKLRTESAEVLEIRELDLRTVGQQVDVVVYKSIYGPHSGSRPPTPYIVGETVHPHEFDWGDRTCAGGIHFFLDRDRAIDF